MRYAATLLCLLTASLAPCRPANADAIFDVALDTSSLVGHAAGPFYFAISFVDGAGIGDGNNTTRISAVEFGGGAAPGGAVTVGGVTGDLTAGITITDTSPVAFFFEPFVPGSTLQFRWTMSQVDDDGGIPDRVIFGLLDSTGTAIPTLAPFGDFLVAIDLLSTELLIEAFGSDPSRAPTFGSPLSIGTPVVTPVPAPVPEPATLALLSIGLGVVSLAKRASRSR
jgi:hypothetical protein